MTTVLRRISPSMVVAVVALVLALAGTGYAAAALPKNSVTSRQVVDRSLRAADFAPNQLPAGRPGPTGAAGPAGPAGAAGPQGPAGPSEALVAARSATMTAVTAVLGAPQGVVVRTLELRPGRYLLTARVEAENTSRAAPANVICDLVTSGGEPASGGEVLHTVPPQSTAAFSRVQFSLDRAVTIGAAGSARVACWKRTADDSVNVRAGITALRVGEIEQR